LSDKIAHHTTEHALANRCNLAAELGFVAIFQSCATVRLRLEVHESRSRSETQWPKSAPDEAKRSSLRLVADLDSRVIGAANAGDADHDLSRVAIRTVLDQATTSGDDGGKLARIQQSPPYLLYSSGKNNLSSAGQRVADRRSCRPDCRDRPTMSCGRFVLIRECPDASQVQRQADIVASERIGHSVCDSGRC
jgi:hypothetical protein